MKNLDSLTNLTKNKIKKHFVRDHKRPPMYRTNARILPLPLQDTPPPSPFPLTNRLVRQLCIWHLLSHMLTSLADCWAQNCFTYCFTIVKHRFCLKSEWKTSFSLWFVLINSVLLNFLCVWILYASSHSSFRFRSLLLLLLLLLFAFLPMMLVWGHFPFNSATVSCYRSLPSRYWRGLPNEWPPSRGRDGQRISNGNAGTMATK